MTMVGAQFSSWKNSRYSIKWRYLAYLTVIMTLLVLGYFRSAEEFQGYTLKLPSDINFSIYRPLQPEVEDDFPTVPEGPAKIPHLLHQTSKSTCVYKENIKYMQSFITLNKRWNYYFWTDTTARALIVEKYKELLELYDGVERGVKRGDLLRYVVMYEFGGVYADTDIENLRPLDRVTRKYSCILPTEPVEQSILLRGLPYMISNAIMLCSPKHPFFKMLLDNIFRSINLRDVAAATGPKFVTEQYNSYNNFFLDISRMSSEELRMKDFLPIGSGQYKADTQLGKRFRH